MVKKFYITTPIYYPNGAPHIGHAYNAIASDALARFARLCGCQTFFLSGTDEHGLKMQQTADACGISPQELADKNSAIFRKLLADLHCSNDDFIRTTQKRHHSAAQEMWRRMEANGDIYLGHYKGWYSVRQEAYYDEKDTFIDKDGIRREVEVGSPVEWQEEESYFFRLSRYQQPLLELYEKQPDFIMPKERRNEIISFVAAGLKDISISRTSFNWGIAVPNAERHVMYVWVDALTNYITALGFGAEQLDEQEKKANKADWSFWPADLHVIGKDIIRFHAIFWPAFLMSAKLPMPKKIFAHGFLLNQGEKMSKSVGNVIDPFDLAEKYGVDALRYFLLREVPFGQDGNYSHELIINRINADLANDLGNLIQRSFALLHKYAQGEVLAFSQLLEQDKKLFAQSNDMVEAVKQHMARQELHLALAKIFAMIGEVNRYFTDQAPWSAAKEDKARFATILYVTLDMLRRIAILLSPFMPAAAAKLLDYLHISKEARSLSDAQAPGLISGKIIAPIEPLFPRYITES